jgi:hypothetical protein
MISPMQRFQFDLRKEHLEEQVDRQEARMHFDRGAAAPLQVRPPAHHFFPAYGDNRQAARFAAPGPRPSFLAEFPLRICA